MQYSPCSQCGGQVLPMQVTVETWDRAGVAAEEGGQRMAGVCQQCGETYFDETSTKAAPSGDL
ncbi:MAG: YgiT-type zinc finger protein [Armatimonadetes bacterium]|nr:YgiT-type zinc finger protein [Armatimonadota bacterium]